MEKYVVPLQQVILTRLFQQLSQVYESVELKFVYELAQFPDPFQITPAMIEKFIMNGCKKGDLAIRVDHISGVLTFDTDVFSSAKALHSGSAAGSAESELGSVQRLQNTPAEIARLQLTRLAKTLHISCMYVDPSYAEARLQAKKTALARAEAGAAKEHEETLERRVVIEKKKEAATDALQRKQREEETRKRLRTQQIQEAEKQRLAEEQREREKKRIKDEQEKIRQAELKKQIEELKSGVKGIDISELDLEDLDANRLRAMKLAQLEKEKNELNDRIRTTGKRIDHLERAFRREELKHVPEDYEAQKKRDMELYEHQKAETLAEAEAKHKEAVALKHRLSRLVPQFSNFRKDVSEKRHEEFEKRRKAAERDFEAKKKQRVKEVQERRRRERIEHENAERARIEEEERAAREEEERVAREEERRRALAEEKAKREEERKLVLISLILLIHLLTHYPPGNSMRWLPSRSSAKTKPRPAASPNEQAPQNPPLLALQNVQNPNVPLPVSTLLLALVVLLLAGESVQLPRKLPLPLVPPLPLPPPKPPLLSQLLPREKNPSLCARPAATFPLICVAPLVLLLLRLLPTATFPPRAPPNPPLAQKPRRSPRPTSLKNPRAVAASGYPDGGNNSSKVDTTAI
jgi:hypothetical protein